MEKSREIHNIPPLYDKNARVLILGSFPSVKSRQAAFFYAHPQNRFWPIYWPATAAPPVAIAEKI
jgi:double-stranded uracil-DNA glycosylase